SFCFFSPSSAQKYEGKAAKTLVKGSQTIVVKLKDNVSISQLQAKRKKLALADLLKINPAHPASQLKRLKPGVKFNFGLDRVYKITIPAEKDIHAIINRLNKFEIVEYVEQYHQMELLYVPDDTEAHPVTGRQNHLDLIKAYDAWTIEKGDSSILIGVLDTGVKINHEDLRNNLFINEADPINGIDDDYDGYVDNYYGWDFADEDNDPTDV